MPYLNVTEQLASEALAPGTPEQRPHTVWFCAGSGSTTLGGSAGSTISAPSRLSTSMGAASRTSPRPRAFAPPQGPAHPPRLILVEPAAGRRLAGRRVLVVEERARD